MLASRLPPPRATLLALLGAGLFGAWGVLVLPLLGLGVPLGAGQPVRAMILLPGVPFLASLLLIGGSWRRLVARKQAGLTRRTAGSIGLFALGALGVIAMAYAALLLALLLA